jgi:pyrroloquinoline-quinone synthase
MKSALRHHFEAALQDRQLLDHPFYRRWEAGLLSRDDVREYAEQYRYFEAMLPDFLLRLSESLAPGPARNLVEANLRDEVTAPSHLELFERFAEFYGATIADMTPATRRLVNAYFEVLRRGSASALALVGEQTGQGAEIADSKAAGLLDHYGAREAAVLFWIEHGSIEVDHATWTFDALASLKPDVDEVEESARLVGDAWWSFLDERERQAA